ncbi:MAG TPA: ammonium transporter [Fimbriimonas sp.]|nr:ammonium transporter [Fimbriimonas sp.]
MHLRSALVAALFLFSSVTFGQGSPIDKADSTWVAICSVLVLLMTPALALFYGGMVRRKNVLSTMLHSLVMMGVVTLLWVLIGYSLAFGKSSGWVGGLEFLMGNGVSMKEPYPHAPGTIPAGLFMLFQMMFAIITPALISGAIAERMRFGAYLLYTSLWSLLIYAPVACWVWNPGGWLFAKGALDFAGGTVVHLASGASALAASFALGKRLAVENREPILPNNLTTTLLGAGLLWVGWIGFNAGSALGMNDLALQAFATTQIAAAAGTLGWLLCEYLRIGKPTALGAASGMVAGLVGITPAAGFVSLGSAIIIGFVVGAACCLAIELKHRIAYDDALDVVGVHGVGGALGGILTGVFAVAEVNPIVTDSLKTNGGRLGLIATQVLGIAVVGVFAFAGTFALLKLINLVTKIRVAREDEVQGLDLALHGESGYNL